MFWQQAREKGSKRFVSLFFDWLSENRSKLKMKGVNSDQPKTPESIFHSNFFIYRLTKLSSQKHKRQKRMWIKLFFLFLLLNGLKMSDDEEPSSLFMSKNQMRRTYLVKYSQKNPNGRVFWRRNCLGFWYGLLQRQKRLMGMCTGAP